MPFGSILERDFMFADPDCIAEYSGVKPDEFVTMDRRNSELSHQYISTNMIPYSSNNSCSTLNRTGYHKDLWNYYGQANMAFQEDTHSARYEPSQRTPRRASSAKMSSVTPLGYNSGELGLPTIFLLTYYLHLRTYLYFLLTYTYVLTYLLTCLLTYLLTYFFLVYCNAHSNLLY